MVVVGEEEIDYTGFLGAFVDGFRSVEFCFIAGSAGDSAANVICELFDHSRWMARLCVDL